MSSDYRNIFCPCKMLVSKVKREGGKGFACRRQDELAVSSAKGKRWTVFDERKHYLSKNTGRSA